MYKAMLLQAESRASRSSVDKNNNLSVTSNPLSLLQVEATPVNKQLQDIQVKSLISFPNV